MGLFDILGKIMQTGGTVANLAGAPYVGVPMSIGGATMSGGSQGGVGGALKGGIGAGVSAAAPIGLNKMLEGVKAGSQAVQPVTELTVPGDVPTTIGGKFEPMSASLQKQAQGSALVPGGGS